MVSLGQIHIVFAWVVIVANGVAGLWALAAHWRESLRRRALWILTAAAQIAIGLQVLIGVLALNLEDAEISQFHMFYGFVGFASVGIIYSYRQQMEDSKYLLYGGGGLFLMGIGLRAVVVGLR